MYQQGYLNQGKRVVDGRRQAEHSHFQGQVRTIGGDTKPGEGDLVQAAALVPVAEASERFLLTGNVAADP
jgi:hypothetical protein